MRVRYCFLLLLLPLIVGTIEAQTSEGQTAENRVVEQLRHHLLANTEPKSFTLADNSTSNRLPLSLVLDSYQFSGGGELVLDRSTQSLISLSSALAFGGLNLELGGRLYLNGGSLDQSRSGIRLGFKRANFVHQLLKNPKNQAWTTAIIDQLKTRQIAASTDLQQAQQVLQFERCLELINAPEYEQYVTEVQAAFLAASTDTVQDRTAEITQLQAQLDTIEQLGATYAQLLHQVQAIPFELRQEAAQRLAEVDQYVQTPDNQDLQKALRSSGQLNGLQKIMLLAKDFSLGQTQLPQDQFASIGLPINGLAYTYENNGMSLGIHWGKRLKSSNFLPIDGRPFHDRLADQRVWRVDLSVAEDYRISLQDFQEIGEGIGSGGALFPRKNRVWSFAGSTKVTERIALLTDFSYSNTELVINGNDPAEDRDWQTQTSIRVAGALQFQQLQFEVGGFQIGPNYESFGNPYLITDYQGIDTRISASTKDGRLQGSFRLALGASLQQQSASANFNRWQAQGQLSYGLNTTTRLGLLVAPNQFRQSVDSEDSFSQANIYRLFLQTQPQIAGRPLLIYSAVTNLDRGLNWQDTTTTTSALVLETQLNYPIGEQFSLLASGRQGLSLQAAEESPEWAYSLETQWAGRSVFALQVRLDRYRFESEPAWGGAVSYQCPLGKFGRLSVFVNYRLTAEDANSPGFFSQQNLSFNR